MKGILDLFLSRAVRVGRLDVTYPDGETRGYGHDQAPYGALALTNQRAVRRLVTDPGLAVGECYMDGSLVPRGTSLYDILDVLALNAETSGGHVVFAARQSARAALRRWAQYNPASRSRRNVAHHYDLNGKLYALFLDRDRQYSCAYFDRGDETLDEAQAAKKRHLAAKLLLQPEHRRNHGRPLRVLDIGCGWGGLALTLAGDYGAEVVGITLSEEQLAEARRRAKLAGLDGQVRFELIDYRDRRVSSMAPGGFDRVVSVGMFEHVGINHYAAFFRRVRELLSPDGVALVHAIGRSHGPSITNAWLAKYIFPGGYSPALSEVLPRAERSGLIVTDVEILRLHYAETLRHWRARFQAQRPTVAELYDERFCRMFEFYLAGSELAFRRQGHMVWQMQLALDHAAVPLTRDYIHDAEHGGLAQVRQALGALGAND